MNTKIARITPKKYKRPRGKTLLKAARYTRRPGLNTENANMLLMQGARRIARMQPRARAIVITLIAGILAASTKAVLRMLSAHEVMGG